METEIEKIEKQAKGIVSVSINSDEKPPKIKRLPKVFKESAEIVREIKKGNIKEGETVILDEREAIQSIKKEKKAIPKPFVSEIQEEKVIVETKIEDLQKEIDNQKKLLDLKIKEAQAEKVKLLKEEKLKKKAERKERRRKHWYFRIFMRKEKKPIEIKEAYSNSNEVKLIEANDTILKICPVCQNKMKRMKVMQDIDSFRQLFKCKKCPFSKEIVIKL